MKRIRLNQETKNNSTTTTTTSSSNSSSSSSVLLFQNAIHQYVDENKPDPIQCKQIQSWNMEWIDDEDDDNDNNNESILVESLQFQPEYCLSGSLKWSHTNDTTTYKNAVVVVTIQSKCYWDGTMEKGGNLYFKCQAKVHFNNSIQQQPSSSLSSTTTTPETTNKSSSSSKSKVHQKMIERLRNDDYISKLLHETGDDDDVDSGGGGGWSDLCEATISHYKNRDHNTADNDTDTATQIIERVHCNEVTAEGIRRCIYSHSDSILDIYDIVCHLPILPPSSSMTSTTNTTNTYDTYLSERARLRILEDAMYDACEKEEENSIVDELHIHEKDTTTKKLKKKENDESDDSIDNTNNKKQHQRGGGKKDNNQQPKKKQEDSNSSSSHNNNHRKQQQQNERNNHNKRSKKGK